MKSHLDIDSCLSFFRELVISRVRGQLSLHYIRVLQSIHIERLCTIGDSSEKDYSSPSGDLNRAIKYDSYTLLILGNLAYYCDSLEDAHPA